MTNDVPPSSTSATTAASAGTPKADAAPASGGARGKVQETVVLADVGIRRALMRIAHEVVESNTDLSRLYLVAVPNGGVPLARILIDNLEQVAGCRVPLGILDTTLYRDDLATQGTRPRLRRTEMPSSVDDQVVVLVEDVVSTGRTIRAAMDALMDFGRPSAVKLVALIDRGHRELPIRIDHVGKNIPTHPGATVTLRGTGDDFDGELEVVVQSEPVPDSQATRWAGRTGEGA